MAKGFKHGAGGGGAGLNFVVVGGTTEPTNPKENTIWVNTDDAITSWIFSATEPEAPIEGMVWGIISTSSPASFNALKKNGIQVYPISAKQYVSGAWVDKTAKTYQNGAWVELNLKLFPPTVGWEFHCSNPAYTLGTCNFDGDVFKGSVSYHQASSIRKKIDFSNIKTITVDFATSLTKSTNGEFWLRVRESKESTTSIFTKTASDTELAAGQFIADVSMVDGEHYLLIGGDCWGISFTFTFEVTNVEGAI